MLATCSPIARQRCQRLALCSQPAMSEDGWETEEDETNAEAPQSLVTAINRSVSNYKCSKNKFGQMEYYLTKNQELAAKAGVKNAIERLELIASSWDIDRNPSGSSFLKHNSVQAYNKHYKGLQFFLLLIGIQYLI